MPPDITRPLAQGERHRAFILTDITSLEAGVREPDDGQSMIRLMLYSNEIELRGLCATSNLGHGQRCRPELIEQIVEAYARDHKRLHEHDARYPAPKYLQGLIRGGQPQADVGVPLEESISEGKSTPAARLLEQVLAEDERPLWVCVWGGTADLAQCLLDLRRTQDEATFAKLASRLRVHAVYDQDSTAAWIKKSFPNVAYITRHHPIRAIYRGGDESLASSQWVRERIRPAGALGALYPDYRGGDPWGGVRGIKEGDTPSWLNLLPGAASPLDGWGGKLFEVAPNRWSDVPEGLAERFDPETGTRWARNDRAALEALWNERARARPAMQHDFERRLSWLR